MKKTANPKNFITTVLPEYVVNRMIYFLTKNNFNIAVSERWGGLYRLLDEDGKKIPIFQSPFVAMRRTPDIFVVRFDKTLFNENT